MKANQETIKNKIKIRELIRKLLPFYKPYKTVFFFDLLSALIMSLCAIVFPILVRKLLYDVIGSEHILWSTLLSVAALMLGIKLVEYAARYYMTTIGHIMGAKMETDIRMSLYDKFLRLPHSFYDTNKVGELMSRITNDLFSITEFCHHCPEEVFIVIVKLIGIFAYLMTINIPLTLILFAVLPVVVIVFMYYNNRMHAIWKENRKTIGELNAHLEDSLSGIRVVKSFANEDVERKKFLLDNEKFVDVKKRGYLVMGAYSAVTGGLSNLLYIIAAVVGAYAIGKGDINSVDLIAYLLYISALLSTIEVLVSFTEQLQQGMSGFSRYNELMDAPESITDKTTSADVERLHGTIVFHNAGFHYNENGQNVINCLNLTIEEGEHLALVGPSGGGKTTMANLIPRFYELTEGSITIDGKDVRDITLKSLRENIGVVQQDVYLFNGTVAENIAYGKLTATREEIENAARLAGAYDFISKLANGFDTECGERGVRLSGGQKQRISIARLFLKNPPILLLDEATSALDNESEMLVQKSLDELAKGRTTITIAHRLTTIKNAKRIIVLTENGIAEQGTHEELVKKNGVYGKLYSLYK